MKISVKVLNIENLCLLFLSFGIVSGASVSAKAQQQRDPFLKPEVRVAKQKITVGDKPKPPKLGPTIIAPPSIQSRIDGYRIHRQKCAELGISCPKPTSVLTLDEMQVTGIFRTPRGYAAMVEASPLNPKLSYTIYPGEKFYDGQLVAIEDTRLIFRRITRMSDGKEIIASADKILRQETINDLATSRPETQLQVSTQSGSLPAASTTTGTTAPQMSAEAVPLTTQKEGEQSASQINQNSLPQKKTEASENAAADNNAATPAAENGSSPKVAPPKPKGKPRVKGNSKNN